MQKELLQRLPVDNVLNTISMNNFGSIGFWRWCATLINTGFLDFVHRPEFYN
jgi:hypothetical protein